jgi:RNA polymerase sigma factor (sigma-70 family)
VEASSSEVAAPARRPSVDGLPCASTRSGARRGKENSWLLHLSRDVIEAALEQLYRDRYVGYRNALATITGSSDSARDAVNEAFARALRSRDQFRGGSLAAWVWRIAVNVAHEQRRDEARATSTESLDPVPLHPERRPDVAEAIRQLPPRRRLVVFLRYFADFSYAEIAEALEISEGTVAATLSEARETLRAPLEGSRHD